MRHRFIDSGYEVVNGERICQRCGNSPNHEYHNPAEPSPEVAPMQEADKTAFDGLRRILLRDYGAGEAAYYLGFLTGLEKQLARLKAVPAVAPRETQTEPEWKQEFDKWWHDLTFEKVWMANFDDAFKAGWNARVEDNAPAMVEPACDHRPQEFPYCIRCGEKASCFWPAAPPANIDDRIADTILDTTLNIPRTQLKRMAKNQLVSYVAHLKEHTGRAETRIEVLEAALREHHLNAISEDQAYQGSEMYERTVAALAAPSGVKTDTPATEPLSPSPEIRYLLRNWHHVNCAGFDRGYACDCWRQREALIAELVAEFSRIK